MTTLIQHLIDAVTLGSIYALLGLGITLVFGIMRLVNFAHGELVMVGAYAAVVIGHGSLPVLIAAVIILPMLFALLMERFAFRPVRRAAETTLLVTSFAVSYLLQNLAMLIFGATPRSINLLTAFSESFTAGGLSIPKLDIATVTTAAVLCAGLTLFLKRTRLGVQVRAASEDFRMARVLGVRANRVIASAFCVSGLLAGVASFLLVSQSGTVYPTMGQTAVLAAFIATVLGGMDSLLGSVAGAMILGLLTVLLESYLPTDLQQYQQAFAYVIVIAVLLGRPDGLFVPKTSRTRI
ncbi:branched-chain amino acid ABC transporter permease [Streptomyces sp. AgN23]|uniref:branched-chain amino acid ABC transporter permease n=1 Tax=Streptomyces sp. AgN23 TaxID=1188315 RepID=UPI001B32518C|nr:branched-chain amino acid ABC transporter permease [Streptomyces sp. AgN23]QTI87265.1 branched-chain amino acid ABC transporter permease [Streptomyces sp. AgN23]